MKLSNCLIVVLFSIFGASAHAAVGSVTPPDILIMTPRDGHVPFTAAIDQAKRQIQMVMFHLSEKSVTSALKLAANRGVEVKIILDHETASSSTSATAIIADLKATGAQVELSSPAFTITHEKSMLIDGQTLFITSMNMTTIFDRSRDFGLVTEEAAEVAEYKTFFETDWSNAQTGGGATPPESPSPVWSPLTSTLRLTDLIGSAKKSLDIMVENLGSGDIQAALANAAKSGVLVRILVPACIEGGTPNRNEPYLDDLAAQGIQTRVMPEPYSSAQPYTHAKLIVADDHKFYLGSENFSFNSLTKAREVGIIRDNAALAQDIVRVFESDFKLAQTRKTAQVWSCSQVAN